MSLLDELAWNAIQRWELEGALPDEEEFDAICLLRGQTKKELARMEAVIQECHHAEHMRRSPKTSSQPLHEGSAADASDDYLQRFVSENSSSTASGSGTKRTKWMNWLPRWRDWRKSWNAGNRM